MRMAFISSLALGMVATPAHAHWQYTRWGMSPEQVVTASKGAAEPLAPSDVEVSEGRKRLLLGSYSSNGRPMAADFWFTGAGLSEVFLRSESSNDCYGLGRDMLTIYGRPLTKKETSMLALTVWVDKAKGNRVSFYHWGSGGCHLSYKPLATSATTGL